MATLYLHFPCFDGIVSGVLAKAFLEKQGWEFAHAQPVNYDRRDTWLSDRLDGPCAVVDFLYHPDAEFWADHHPTTFLNKQAEDDFRSRNDQWLFYNRDASSCAGLLWEKLSAAFEKAQAARLQEMVRWAEKIDSARYASVEEAILGDAPAIKISHSLMRRPDQGYCQFLLENLSRSSLDEVSRMAEVSERFDEARARIQAGLARFEPSARVVAGGIVVFDIEAHAGSAISRYSPFYFFPSARYSVGVVRHTRGARITAMRNPWVDFPSVPLGAIFERFGGGGHQRVGALILPSDRAGEASGILKEIVSEIRRQESEVTAQASGG